MKRLAVLALSTAFALSSALAAPAAFGTKDEAVAMVKKGVAFLAKEGTEKGLAEMSKTNGLFVDRDLYLFGLDFAGKSIANGGNPSLVGKNLMDLKDPDGVLFVKELVALAKTKGSGWFAYRWMNKKTGKIEPKLSYVERVGTTDTLIGCGILDASKK